MKEKKFLTNLDRFNEEFDDLTVDTANTPDMGWETGVLKKDKEWVIVGNYPDKEAAKKGHDKIVEALKSKTVTFEELEEKHSKQHMEWFLSGGMGRWLEDMRKRRLKESGI